MGVGFGIGPRSRGFVRLMLGERDGESNIYTQPTNA